MNRRHFIAASAATLATHNLFAQKKPNLAELKSVVEQLEKQNGGRLGVAVQDVQSGAYTAYRGDERFPMCSTFKLSLVAAVLDRVDKKQERLDRYVSYTQDAILSYAPATSKHVSDGMSIAALCEAAITLSDNTAANLLLNTIDGPAGLTNFWRSIGDNTSRLDRNEPTLNTAIPGDDRDTTTPDAMLRTLQRLTIGTNLSAPSRKRLIDWMLATTTGLKKIKAGLPADWKEGDKTGSGDNNTTNDIAILYPPGRKPVLITVYYTNSQLDTDHSNLIFQQIGKQLARLYS